MTSSFNFNLISHRDLRKFLTKKMEIEKWEFSSAFDAILAHYSYQPQMSYGFPHSKNMKIDPRHTVEKDVQISSFILYDFSSLLRSTWL